MDSVFVLKEELAALERLLAPADRSTQEAGVWLDAPEFLDLLATLFLRMHLRKTNEVILERIRMAEAAQHPEILDAVMDQENAREALERVLDQKRSGQPVDRETLQELAMAVLLALAAEDHVLIPTVVRHSSDDELWQIGVELDRAVDQEGRELHAQYVNAVPLVAPGLSHG